MKGWFVVVLLFLFSCGWSGGNVQAVLLERKKNIEDSIQFARTHEDYYMQRAWQQEPGSPRMKRCIDSSLYFAERSRVLRKKLEPVLRSIDSTTKLR